MAGKKSKLDGKTGKTEFNKASGAGKVKKPHRNYSHKELLDKMDRYSSVAKTGRQLRDTTDMKKEYLERNLQKADRRLVRNHHYRMGIKKDIHPKETLENLRQQDKEQDQRDRNKVADKVKDYTHRNYTPSQIFNAHAPEKPKDMSIDKS